MKMKKKIIIAASIIVVIALFSVKPVYNLYRETKIPAGYTKGDGVAWKYSDWIEDGNDFEIDIEYYVFGCDSEEVDVFDSYGNYLNFGVGGSAYIYKIFGATPANNGRDEIPKYGGIYVPGDWLRKHTKEIPLVGYSMTQTYYSVEVPKKLYLKCG
jgi:hypothetical protein